MDDITERVRQVIAKELRRPVGDVLPQASFAEHLQADSLEIVELVLALEREFDIKIPDAEAEKLRTVQDAVSYIRSSLS